MTHRHREIAALLKRAMTQLAGPAPGMRFVSKLQREDASWCIEMALKLLKVRRYRAPRGRK